MPNELVIVDDCSTDNTVNILNSFKAKAPFEVKILLNEQNIGGSMPYGYGQIFSKTLANSTGDMFSHQTKMTYGAMKN